MLTHKLMLALAVVLLSLAYIQSSVPAPAQDPSPTPIPTPEPYIVSTSATTVAPGEVVTANWSAPTDHSAVDWIGLYQVSTSDGSFISWQYTGTDSSGSMNFAASSLENQYEFRYYLNDGYTLVASSTPFTVALTPTPTPTPTPAPTPLPVSGTVYYVSPDGSDSNVGDLSTPFLTVAKGLSILRAGDTLYLRGGTYVEDVWAKLQPGTEQARITVRNYPGEKPIIKGKVGLYKPDYWTFDGFNVTWNIGNFDEHMVKFIGGRDWVLENSEISGAQSFANILVCCSPSNWVLRNNTIYDTPGGELNIFRSHNIYVNTNLDAGPGLIERNLVFNAPRGCNIKIAGPDKGSQYGSANVTVRYNTLSSGVQPLLIGDGSTNILVERNIIVTGVRPNTTTYLLRLYRLTGENNVVRNNLGSDAGKWCLDYDGGDYTCARIDGGGNLFPVNPEFDSIGIGGFHPQNSAAKDYGKYAIH